MTLRARLLAKVRPDAALGCWVWTGCIAGTDGGYGQIRVKGRGLAAHRVAYELFVGPIPEGLQLDHLCRNKHCVNPEHLEPVTASENKRRDHEASGLCRNGLHAKNDETMLVSRNGKRRCRPCMAETQRRYRARKLISLDEGTADPLGAGRPVPSSSVSGAKALSPALSPARCSAPEQLSVWAA